MNGYKGKFGTVCLGHGMSCITLMPLRPKSQVFMDELFNLLIYIVAQQVRVKPPSWANKLPSSEPEPNSEPNIFSYIKKKDVIHEARTWDLSNTNTSLKPLELHKQLVYYSKALITYFKTFVFIFVSISYLFEMSYYFS